MLLHCTPCVQVLWDSVCNSTWPKQRDYLLGEGRLEVGLCFSWWLSSPCEHETAHSAFPALGLPSVHTAKESSSQATACELCSPLSFPPHSSDSSLHWGCSVQTPFSPGGTLGGWISVYSCSKHQSLHTASNSFLGNSFFMEINLFGQGCSLLLFGLFSRMSWQQQQ